MTISSLDKNSMGICLSLLLVILLSESRLFKFFIDSYLGRAFLIIILLFASYLNKILGVTCVFIIIIMFNKNNFASYYEGFDDNVTNKNDDKTNTNVTTTTDSMSETTTTGENKNKPITTPTPVPNDKINVVTSSSTSSKDTETTDGNSVSNTDIMTKTVSKSIEGFDLQSTENNIKRGKQSNSIPVNQYNKQSIEVAPYETASFSNFFGLL